VIFEPGEVGCRVEDKILKPLEPLLEDKYSNRGRE